MKPKEGLGAIIHQLMVDRGLNQTQLAAKSGVERSVLNRIINDHSPPKRRYDEYIGRIARGLGVTPAQLLNHVKRPLASMEQENERMERNRSTQEEMEKMYHQRTGQRLPAPVFFLAEPQPGRERTKAEARPGPLRTGFCRSQRHPTRCTRRKRIITPSSWN